MEDLIILDVVETFASIVCIASPTPGAQGPCRQTQTATCQWDQRGSLHSACASGSPFSFHGVALPTYPLAQSSAISFCKGLKSKYFRLSQWPRISVIFFLLIFFFFLTTLKNVKSILSFQTIDKQATDQIWPTNCPLPTFTVRHCRAVVQSWISIASRFRVMRRSKGGQRGGLPSVLRFRPVSFLPTFHFQSRVQTWLQKKLKTWKTCTQNEVEK